MTAIIRISRLIGEFSGSFFSGTASADENALLLFGDESGPLLLFGDSSGSTLLWGDGG